MPVSTAICRWSTLSSAAEIASENAVEAAVIAAAGDACHAGGQFARFKPRLAIGRGRENHRIVDRRGFDRQLSRRGRRQRPACGPDRAGGGNIAAKRGGALLQYRLPLQQRVEFLLELFLVEQLPAGDAIDLRAQFGDAVLISELHLGLAPDQSGEHVLVECKISSGGDRPDRHDHQRADHDPERDGADADLASAVDQCVVAAAALQVARHGGSRLRGIAAAGVGGSRVVRLGRMRHRLSAPGRPHAGPVDQPVDINRLWLKKRKFAPFAAIL